MIAQFKVSKVVIVESLANEFHSGDYLHRYLLGLAVDGPASVPVEFVDCEHSTQFQEILLKLAAEANTNGAIPILHIECHGLSDQSGLVFRNGSSLQWPSIAESMVALNIATRFNLLVIFAACFGAQHLGEMKPGQPSPCWGMIGPSEEIYPDEILGGFRDFYRTLLEELDLTKAVNLLILRKLTIGNFIVATSEDWFRNVMRNYATQHCSPSAILERTKFITEAARAKGSNAPNYYVYAALLAENSKAFDESFAKFFLTQQIPENRVRFAKSYEKHRGEYLSLLPQ